VVVLKTEETCVSHEAVGVEAIKQPETQSSIQGASRDAPFCFMLRDVTAF